MDIHSSFSQPQNISHQHEGLPRVVSKWQSEKRGLDGISSYIHRRLVATMAGADNPWLVREEVIHRSSDFGFLPKVSKPYGDKETYSEAEAALLIKSYNEGGDDTDLLTEIATKGVTATCCMQCLINFI